MPLKLDTLHLYLAHILFFKSSFSYHVFYSPVFKKCIFYVPAFCFVNICHCPEFGHGCGLARFRIKSWKEFEVDNWRPIERSLLSAFHCIKRSLCKRYSIACCTAYSKGQSQSASFVRGLCTDIQKQHYYYYYFFCPCRARRVWIPLVFGEQDNLTDFASWTMSVWALRNWNGFDRSTLPVIEFLCQSPWAGSVPLQLGCSEKGEWDWGAGPLKPRKPALLWGLFGSGWNNGVQGLRCW